MDNTKPCEICGEMTKNFIESYSVASGMPFSTYLCPTHQEILNLSIAKTISLLRDNDKYAMRICKDMERL